LAVSVACVDLREYLETNFAARANGYQIRGVVEAGPEILNMKHSLKQQSPWKAEEECRGMGKVAQIWKAVNLSNQTRHKYQSHFDSLGVGVLFDDWHAFEISHLSALL